MSIAVRLDVSPISPLMGAEVHGIDLAKPLDEETFAAIRAAFNRHMLLSTTRWKATSRAASYGTSAATATKKPTSSLSWDQTEFQFHPASSSSASSRDLSRLKPQQAPQQNQKAMQTRQAKRRSPWRSC